MQIIQNAKRESILLGGKRQDDDWMTRDDPIFPLTSNDAYIFPNPNENPTVPYLSYSSSKYVRQLSSRKEKGTLKNKLSEPSTPNQNKQILVDHD
jgi:hypothetical protein